MVVILGAGLAGLSTAYHLGRECLVLEREGEPGGLCRSYATNGFWFDQCGHVLHLRDPYALHLAHELLPGKLRLHRRRAYVYTHDRYVPYPFQANLHGLPPEVVAECLTGFLAARDHTARGNGDAVTLRDWILERFGPGIARHFMFPYNEKLWCRDLGEIRGDEIQWSIPQPDEQTVIRGASGRVAEGLGYNAEFYYPVSGGTGALAGALARAVEARHAGALRIGEAAVAIDLDDRAIVTSRGARVPYEALVSTIPLPELIRLLRPPRPALLDLSAGLRHVSVACVNLGFAPGPPVTRHWVYFPEPRFDFFRAGSYSALADAPGPSFFVEFARPAGAPLPAGLPQRALDGLRACGLVPGDAEPVAADVIDLAYAYVVHDRARSSIVPQLRAWLREHGIRTAGRYGDWQYGSMESALLAGRNAAAELG